MASECVFLKITVSHFTMQFETDGIVEGLRQMQLPLYIGFLWIKSVNDNYYANIYMHMYIINVDRKEI